MVHVVKFGVGAPTEQEAISTIASTLKDESHWLLVCNYGDHVASLTEIDMVLICPGAIICIELKNWRGQIHAVDGREWTRVRPSGESEGEKNPLHQSKHAMDLLLSHLTTKYSSLRDKFWLSFAAVFTNARSTLQYDERSESLKNRVFVINDFKNGLARHLSYDHKHLSKKASKCDDISMRELLEALGIGQSDIDAYIDNLSGDRPYKNKNLKSGTKSNQPNPLQRETTAPDFMTSHAHGLWDAKATALARRSGPKAVATPKRDPSLAYKNLRQSEQTAFGAVSSGPSSSNLSHVQRPSTLAASTLEIVKSAAVTQRTASFAFPPSASIWRSYPWRLFAAGISVLVVVYELYIVMMQPVTVPSSAGAGYATLPQAAPPIAVDKPFHPDFTSSPPQAARLIVVPPAQIQRPPAPVVQAQALPEFEGVVPPSRPKSLPVEAAGVIRGYQPPLGPAPYRPE